MNHEILNVYRHHDGTDFIVFRKDSDDENIVRAINRKTMKSTAFDKRWSPAKFVEKLQDAGPRFIDGLYQAVLPAMT